MNYRRPLVSVLVLLLVSVLPSLSGAAQTKLQPRRDLTAPRVALSSQDSIINVAASYGPLHYGAEFGLNMTSEHFTQFDSHTVAVQAVLSGQHEILGTSFGALLLLREAGQDFKVFCIRTGNGDNVLVGRNGVTKIEQLLDSKTRIAVDSPGGAADTILNAMLQAHKLKVTTKDLPGVRIFESSRLRIAALVANEVDVAVMTLLQFRRAETEVPSPVIISKLYEDVPYFLHSVYAAPASWLDTNLDVAAAFCASVVKAQRAIIDDVDLYLKVVNEMIPEPPSEALLRETWEFAAKNDIWNLTTGLQPEAVEFVSNVMVTSNLLKKKASPENVYDLRPYQMLIKLIGEYKSKTESSATAEIPPTQGS
jgi:ABC-type nitrate/sulfonate/bicarbonate transport system substrate-binding protein